MTDKDILISDLNDISEILNNNGYGGWCKTIRKAVALLKEQEHKDRMFHALEEDWKRLNGLLKEQEAEIEQLNRFVNGFSRDAVPVVRCKDCRYGQYCTDGETTYQCFKWNSNEFGALHEQDWFCADGERVNDA